MDNTCTRGNNLATRPGKHTKNYGKSPFSMGKSTISMAIFNSYVKLPEGTQNTRNKTTGSWLDNIFLQFPV